jgi:hypothetical protein
VSRLQLNTITFRPGPPEGVKKCKEAEAKATGGTVERF